MSIDTSGLNLGWLAGIGVLVVLGVLVSQGWIDHSYADYVRGAVAGAAVVHTAPKVVAKRKAATVPPADPVIGG